jgi:hypothetical protein
MRPGSRYAGARLRQPFWIHGQSPEHLPNGSAGWQILARPTLPGGDRRYAPPEMDAARRGAGGAGRAGTRRSS